MKTKIKSITYEYLCLNKFRFYLDFILDLIINILQNNLQVVVIHFFKF